MNQLLIAVLILAGAAAAEAQTYQWTDDNGVISFSDDLNAVPTKYRSKVRRREDITTRNPQVRQDLREQEQRAQEDALRSGGAPGGIQNERSPQPTPTPTNAGRPSALPAEQGTPGRTKSQRVRENMERRMPPQ